MSAPSCKPICETFKINNDEYLALEKEFGQLTKYEAWQLLKKNAKNNHTNEFEDVHQELLWSLVRAGSYYKRQVFIESCLIRCIEFAGGPKSVKLLEEIVEVSKPESGLRHEAILALERIAQRPSGKPANDLTILILQELVDLWHNRTRHGASKQKFGPHQEAMLERLVQKVIPKTERPSKEKPLDIDAKFKIYCKAITWNTQKSMGRKITKEKSIRSGQVSLSDYDYLATAGNGY